MIENREKLLLKLFSITNEQSHGGNWHKIIYILGLKISFKIKDKKYYKFKNCPSSKRPEMLKEWYFDCTGKSLNLENPQTFNEKIQWLKLYDSTPLKTRLADKYLVRDWVKEKIGEEYLIPLLGVWDKFEDIDFEKLPNQFVLKCNHGCGYNIIVKEKSKLNKKEAKNKTKEWLNEDFAFRFGFELQYSDIPRKIIAEKFIGKNDEEIVDYKLWCFNGKVHYIQYLTDRNIGLRMAFFNPNWEKQDFVYSYPIINETIERPNCLDKMIQLAEILSKDFNHVRVDFYITPENEIKFGEMTFTSCSGVCDWNNPKIDIELGDLLKIPNSKEN